MAASTRLVPAATSTVRSLIVTLGTSYAPFSNLILEIAPMGEGAGPIPDVLVDLVLEALDQRLHRTDRRVAQGAERVAADVRADREEDLRIALRPLAVLDPLEHQLHPVRPLAAGRALPARFVVEELREPRNRPHHAGGVVHHDDRRRAEHRARLGHRVEVHLDVDLVRLEDRRRRAAGDERLPRPTLQPAPAAVA